MAADIPAANDAIAHEPARPRHHLVSPPKYIRTQSIGLLSRSKTLSSSLNSAPAIPIPLDDKRHRRTSVPFPSAENEVLPGPPQRPLKRRSDSLPAFPADQPQPVARLRPANDTGIPRERKSMLFEYGQPCAISELPSDPKTWTPSQLSVYVRPRKAVFESSILLISYNISDSSHTYSSLCQRQYKPMSCAS